MAPDRQAHGGTLILGGGFAGSSVARLLGKRGATVVSPENFMLYTPLLPEAASGTLEPRHVVVPLRAMARHAELLLGRAVGLDAERRRVRVEAGEQVFWVGYDNLVIALGAVARTLPIPGLAEHALGFKDLPDAIQLRNHILRRLEAAVAAPNETHRRRELSFVFVGAGYAGVEALAELSDLVRDALRYYPSIRHEPQRWVLVDAAPKILPEIPTRLGDYAAKLLARRGVEIHVSTTLEAVEPHAALLSDGTRVLTSTVVWTAGIRPQAILSELGLPATSAAASSSGRRSRSRDTSGSGRSATVRASPTSPRPTIPTRRPASTRSDRQGVSSETSPARPGLIATGCSARSRRWVATGGSPT